MRRLILMLIAALTMVLTMALSAGSAVADTYNIDVDCQDCVDFFSGNTVSGSTLTFNF